MTLKRRNEAYIFWLSSALGVVAIRLWVFIFPTRKILVRGVLIHHFWMGLALMLLALVVPRGQRRLRLVTFSLGFAAFADELFFILRGKETLADYWSTYSLIGVMIVMAGAFIARDKLSQTIL